jgi:hypothetical protein
MMKKSFDCVEMKNNIQKKLLERWEGLTPEQIRLSMLEELRTDESGIGQLWRRLEARDCAAGPAGFVLCETEEPYHVNSPAAE